ncbi:ZIP family metal transporter [Brevibacillus daliensis]|uniref:ZIP family metal transporter n=1 Tax=Brevibacillus daliensis TaxID=2892995 RepID=UPI001E51FA22|nr:ZIP family metal transporter [Brevibacillus daliensis]
MREGRAYNDGNGLSEKQWEGRIKMEWHPSFMLLLFLVCAASLLGSFVICFRRQWSEASLFVMISIGGGILFSLTILDLLPHAMDGEGNRFLPLVLVGFMLLFLLENVRNDQEKVNANNMVGVTFGFYLHAFFEGFSLAAGMQAHASLAIPLMIGLILHRLPDGVTVSSLLLAATRSRVMAFLGGVGLCLATMLGAFTMRLTGMFISASWNQAGLALSAGVFLYVAASHLVPLLQQKQDRKLGLYFVLSVLLYMIFSLFFHSHTM